MFFLEFNVLWEANELQKKARDSSPNIPKFTCCLFLSITKAASLQHVPCFQQWQHLVKPPGSAGEGQGFPPGSEVGFHFCIPDQRDWEGIQDVGYNPQTPTPKLFSIAHAWVLNLPGLLLRGGVSTEQAQLSCTALRMLCRMWPQRLEGVSGSPVASWGSA